MEISEILNIVLSLLCAIGAGVMVYLKVRGNVIEAVSEFIALAEATNLTGAEKMAKVVSQLAALVPAPLKTILTATRLEAIAQWVFEWMRKYAREYQNRVHPDTTNEEAKSIAEAIGGEAVIELIAELLTLSMDLLRERAAEFGINTDGMVTEKEIAVEIAKCVLNTATAGPLPPA